MNKTRSGFTLVEILIVIVVIAILATITTISYNSIQQRARNTITVDTAKTWMDILALTYVADGPIFISDVSTNGLCLGGLENYPPTAHLAAGQCHDWPGEDAYVSGDLQAAVNTLAKVNMATFKDEMNDPDGGRLHYARGVQYSNAYGKDYLYYILEGEDRDCVLQGSEIGGSDYGNTECRVPISDIIGGRAIIWTY